MTSYVSNGPAAGSGLMVFWASIDPAHWLRYQQWHNCEHIPERVAIPGFRVGRRYRSAARPERFMMFYETDGSQVLASPAYLHALQNPTPWTREALGWFRDPARSVYVLESSGGESLAGEAPLLLAIRHDSDTLWSISAELGRGRVRHYALDPSASNVQTSERAIHGAAPTLRRRLALIECAKLDLLSVFRGEPPDTGMPDLAALAGVPDGAAAEVELYWFETALRSPNIEGWGRGG
jgi:hypothetical protein